MLSGRLVGLVGAGIGGLAAALALRRRDANVIVFERQRRLHQGVALLVWSNAMRQLSELGVADDLLRVAAPIDITQIRNPAGELLCELPIGEWSERAGMPSVVVRRADLVDTLARRLPTELVRDGVGLSSFAQHGDRVELTLTDGTTELCDALIGADGLHSTVRAQLHGDHPPRALRQQAWVGFARSSGGLARGVATATVGRGPRFWSAPLGDGVFWYATLNDLVGGDGRAALHAAFDGWHAPIRDLIDDTADPDLVSTQIRDRVPSPRWGDGLVTLLGDAAHASTPDLGQGACQAIESAVVLAESLEREDSLEAGLRAYEAARMQRTATISRLCWLTSVNSTVENAALCAVRDAAMRVALRTVARGHLEWILAGPAC